MAVTVCYPQKKRTIHLETCDELSFDKQGGRSYQVLRGNVRFRHEDVLMYCDSVYFYDNSSNSFDAFGHVRVVQPGGSNMLSDSVFYDGATTLMRVRGNVSLTSGTSTLRTHHLDFYRDKNYGYYYGGGDMVDENRHLVSRNGYYYADAKSYLFNDSVVLQHPDYTIYADSLRYQEAVGRATLLGESTVIGEKYTVNTTRGWIDTKGEKTSEGRLYNHSKIRYRNGKEMTADSIHFDSKRGWVKAYNDVEVKDTVQKIIVRGGYMEGDSVSPSYAKVLQKPYIVSYDDEDSLYLKADILYAVEMDSTHDEFRAYHNVWIFRKDMQGKCDSLVYFVQDSMARMYDDPVIWSENNQLLGDKHIEIYMKNQKPDRIVIPSKPLIVDKEGEDEYNQLTGKKAVAYIVRNRLRRVDLIGEATSLYYTVDDNGYLVGLNKAVGSEMSIFTNQNKLDKIIMTPDSEGIMYPPDKIPDEERYLRGFKWLENECPKTLESFFLK